MSDETTVSNNDPAQEPSDADQHAAAFAAGFNDTETPADTPAPSGSGEAGQTGGEGGSAADAPQQFVQITRGEWDAYLQRQADLQAELVKLRDTATGQIGGLQRALTQVQSGAELTADDFAGLKELGLDDVAESIARDLSSALKKVPRVAHVEPAAPVDPEAITRKVLFDIGVRGLEEAHPDFREVRDSAAFQEFMSKKPQAEQVEFATTINPAFASRYFTEFKKQRAAAPTASTRRDRFAAAETPRGSPTPPPRGGGQSERDAFKEGFASG